MSSANRIWFVLKCSLFPFRLLFATTNHIERLDPALSRPGRMDVWVNFTHATKWQAEGIFKCFFPFKPSTVAAPASTAPKDPSQQNLPLPKRKAHAHAIPILTEEEISILAKSFAESIPEDELSVSLHAIISAVVLTSTLGRKSPRVSLEKQDSPS